MRSILIKDTTKEDINHRIKKLEIKRHEMSSVFKTDIWKKHLFEWIRYVHTSLLYWIMASLSLNSSTTSFLISMYSFSDKFVIPFIHSPFIISLMLGLSLGLKATILKYNSLNASDKPHILRLVSAIFHILSLLFLI